MFLLTKENPLFSYMMLNLEETAENTPMHQRITINDIVMNFTEWYKPQNNGLEPPEAIVKPVAID